MENQESDQSKKSMGIGIIALVVSAIGALMVANIYISFIRFGVLSLNIPTIYTSLALSIISVILGSIVEILEHSDEKYGSIAKTISGWSIAALVAIYMVIKFN